MVLVILKLLGDTCFSPFKSFVISQLFRSQYYKLVECLLKIINNILLVILAGVLVHTVVEIKFKGED